MKKLKTISFWLILALGLSATVFTACSEDDDKTEDITEETTSTTDGDGSIAITNLSLDTTKLSLTIGSEYTIIATVTPDNAINNTVTWSSSATNIATVVAGKVTAKAEGTAIITAVAGTQTATCAVTVKLDYVLINGVKWAKYNVASPGTFTDSFEGLGMFYQWNSNIGWSSIDPLSPSDGSSTWDNSWDASYSDTWSSDPSPTGYRVPTNEEFESLLNTSYVINEWVTQNGVSGMKFTNKFSGESIFLPASGYRGNEGWLYNYGSYGDYWSSTTNNGSHSYYLRFSDTYAGSTDGSWVDALTIRPVVK